MKELTDRQIQRYRDEAERLKLEGRGLLYAEPDLIRRVCNGIGAEWMSLKLRATLDAIHPAFVLPSLIHDLQYYFWDGEAESLARYNAQFGANGKVVARDMYCCVDPRRYGAYLTARRYKRILDAFGRTAAVAAREERLKTIQGA